MPKPTRGWRKWHRWGGLLAALPVMVLVVSGLLLNHLEPLGLDDRRLPPALASWYGVTLDGEVLVSRVTEPPLYHAGDRLFIGDEPLAACPAPFRGAVSLERLVVAGCDDALLLMSPAGELVEHLGAAWGLPSFGRLGVYEGQAVLDTPDGAVLLDAEQLQTRPLPGGADWRPAAPEPASAEVTARFRRHAVPAEFDYERWLLDLHSGRIAGVVGILIMDAAALVLLALAMTGLVIWWRGRRS